MRVKCKIGIALMSVGLLLLAVTIFMVGSNLAVSGPYAGAITTYRPPFASHGLLAVLTGIVSAAALLSGIILTVLGKSE